MIFSVRVRVILWIGWYMDECADGCEVDRRRADYRAALYAAVDRAAMSAFFSCTRLVLPW